MLGFHGIDPKGGTAAILGSGGAAKAAMQALYELGVQDIYVVSRTPQGKAASVSNARFIGYEDLQGVSGALLLNATPVGMWPHGDASPVSEETVARFSAIVDTIYNPWETQLLAMARHQNKPCCNGLYMLVAQAMRAEEIFLDRTIPSDITDLIYRELAKRLNP
jgi:shikimate dehydrogenase